MEALSTSKSILALNYSKEKQKLFIKKVGIYEIILLICGRDFKYTPLGTIKNFLDNVIEILESDNEVVVRILKVNIKVFLEAIRS
jgi:hypothetical protein